MGFYVCVFGSWPFRSCLPAPTPSQKLPLPVLFGCSPASLLANNIGSILLIVCFPINFQDVTMEHAYEALRNSGQSPAMVAFFEDGTPAFAWKRRVVQVTPTRSVIRQGGRACEMLLQRMYVHIGGGDPCVIPVLAIPRPLTRHTRIKNCSHHARLFSRCRAATKWMAF